MGAALVEAAAPRPASGSPCSTRCYLTSTVDGAAAGRAAAAVRRRRRGRAGRTGSTRSRRRRARAGRRRRPLGPGGPGRRAPDRGRVGRRRGAPLHVHLSEQRAENEACLAVHGRTPTAAARRRAALLGPRTTAVHATHLTDADRAAARRHRHRRLPVPHHRTRPGRRHRPGPGAGRRRQPAVPRQRQPRRDRPVRGGPRGRAGRAAAHRAARATSPPPSCSRAATAAGHAALGWTDAGRIAPGARADLVTVRLDTRRAPPACRPGRGAVFAATAADVDARRGRTAGVGRAATASTLRRSTCPRALRDGDRGGDWPMSPAGRPTSASWSPTTRRRRRRRSGCCATPRWSSRTAGSPGSARRADAPAADRRARRRRRARCCPASWTATPTWSSPATGRPSSPPGWPASRTPAAASAPRSPRPGPPPTTSCAANVARLRARGAAAGHHHDRDQERVRADRRRRGARRCGSPREFTAETTFLGAHVVPAEYAGRPDDYVALVCGRDARPPPRRTPAGSTCSASGARSTPTRPARS